MTNRRRHRPDPRRALCIGALTALLALAAGCGTSGPPTSEPAGRPAGTTPVTTGTPASAPPPGSVAVAAVGDMVCPPGAAVTAITCRQQRVSDLVADDPTISRFLALGDLQYETGALDAFRSAYGPSFGRVDAITEPVPGNHEYGTAGAAGYFAYFGDAAGDPARGYESFDLGDSWHLVALNSNCSHVACGSGSAQTEWLRADLAATTRPCVLAYWHHPRFSSSAVHGNDPAVAPFWAALEEHRAEVVLSGHDHGYERFDPQRGDATADPAGIRAFVVGTGGRSLYPFADPAQPNSAARISTFGILVLTLGPGTYSWQFVDETGAVLDTGTGTCG